MEEYSEYLLDDLIRSNRDRKIDQILDGEN